MSRSIQAAGERLLRLPYEELSRGELLTRYVFAADVRAFEVLVRRCTPLVLERCRATLHQPAEAEEVAAEVFALVAIKATGIRDPERIDAWLGRTAEYLCVNRNRKAAHRSSVERPLRPEELGALEQAAGPPPDVVAELREQHEHVLREIDRLSETLRRTLDAVQKTDSYGEAAALLGCSLAKVKKDVSRARHELLRQLRAKGIILPAALAAALFGPRAEGIWARTADAAQWLARKGVVWAVLVAAVGTITLIWAASPGGPDEPGPVVEVVRVQRPPVVVPETLEARNQRIFREKVERKLADALGKLGGGEVHLVELRAEGSEVFGLFKGSKPLGGDKPPRIRFSFCVLTRHLRSELDLFGDGKWGPAGAEKIVIRPEFFGKTYGELTIPLGKTATDISDAFKELPPDERALEAVNALLSRQPVADELVVPRVNWWSVGSNSRHLYVVTDSGLLLARAGRGGDPHWRCIGVAGRPSGDLAANEESLFWVREDHQIVRRPADLADYPSKPIGPELPGGGALWAGRDALFCVKADFTLWSRPIDSRPREWRQVGTVPGGRKGAVFADRLYCLSTRDGRASLWARPLDDAGAAWSPAGDYTSFTVKNDWADCLHLEVWQDQFLAWTTSDERIFARPAGPQPHPWKQIGRIDWEFPRRW